MFTFDLKWIVPAVILTSDRLLNSEINLQQGEKLNEKLHTILKQAIHAWLIFSLCTCPESKKYSRSLLKLFTLFLLLH